MKHSIIILFFCLQAYLLSSQPSVNLVSRDTIYLETNTPIKFQTVTNLYQNRLTESEEKIVQSGFASTDERAGGSPFDLSVQDDILSNEGIILVKKDQKVTAIVDRFDSLHLYFRVVLGRNIQSVSKKSIEFKEIKGKFKLVDSPQGRMIYAGTTWLTYTKKDEKIITTRKCPGIPLGARRLALVIGNANYKIKPLNNPLHDARDMAEQFLQLDFDTLYRENLDILGILDALESFRDTLKVKNYDVGLIYYSGHGMEIDMKTYIMPLNAQLQKQCYVKKTCIEITDLLEAMPVPKKVIILDACRDNPLDKKSEPTKSFNEIVEDVDVIRVSTPQDGTLLVYSTSSGKTASDGGQSKNGAYTGNLKQCLREEKIIVFPDIFECASVKMGNTQKPENNSKSFGRWYLRW